MRREQTIKKRKRDYFKQKIEEKCLLRKETNIFIGWYAVSQSESLKLLVIRYIFFVYYKNISYFIFKACIQLSEV